MFWQFLGVFCCQRAAAAEAAEAATAGPRHVSCEGALVSPIPATKRTKCQPRTFIALTRRR